jgi:hypothetical protein
MASTVQVKAYPRIRVPTKPTTDYGFGTGWIFHGKNGHTFVWTVGHVLMGARGTPPNDWGEVRVCDKEIVDGMESGVDHSIKAKVLRLSYCEDETLEDLALLTIQDRYYKESSVISDEDKYPKLGSNLLLAGCTGGGTRGMFISSGVLGRRGVKLGSFQFDHTTTPGVPGCSGGPITDKDGNVVGSIMGGRTECHGYYIPIHRIRAWAKKMKVEYAVDATIDVPEKLKYVEEVGTHKQKD